MPICNTCDGTGQTQSMFENQSCGSCGGSGSSGGGTCGGCGGSGSSSIPQWENCFNCYGSGYIDSAPLAKEKVATQASSSTVEEKNKSNNSKKEANKAKSEKAQQVIGGISAVIGIVFALIHYDLPQTTNGWESVGVGVVVLFIVGFALQVIYQVLKFLESIFPLLVVAGIILFVAYQKQNEFAVSLVNKIQDMFK